MKNRFNEYRTILVTGGAGFIGSNFIPFYLKNNSNVRIINLDKLTYAGNLDNLKEVANDSRHLFVQGDICNKELVNKIFEEYNIDGIVHFAAESHVDNSIEDPQNFIKTNIEGTFVLLEAARKYWMNSPFQVRKGMEHARFHHISTDEVFGSLGATGYFTEDSSYAPNSPYSASKASSDFLVRSYFHTYGLNVVTSNCSNNYGLKQHDEKLIPTIIRKALNEEEIPIYGNGSNIRDWLYVMDHCKGISKVFQKGRSGETYVLGGNNELSSLKISKEVCVILDNHVPKSKGSYLEQITFVSDRPGHDFRYAIDSSKIKNELGWFPKESLDSGLERTVSWYVDKYRKGRK
ncbi:dTDP-glucose 4,6-dehydratase [Maribacter algicola]|uniref:dTDP-glucose 4,6-dehydratase n=1 Tax=Maribacter algicola TaxID=2498892 RepID=A0A3R8S1M3_9FLAO|nr:dTDP-glucose 4,6-dehydratase [Maribacter algicola]RRQ50026.1 dTDP-glucose 4,6-dehydratase [Maribacter algicola]